MTILKSSIRDWLGALVETLEELSVTYFDRERVSVQRLRQKLPNEGLYQAVMNVDPSVQISLLSDGEGFRRLTAVLLKMDPKDAEQLTEEEVGDAMGEVVNVISGMVKRKISDIPPDQNLGLPVFERGDLKLTADREKGSVEMMIGDVPARITVTRRKDDLPGS